MFEARIDRCVLVVDPNFVCDRLRYEFDRYKCRRFAIQGKLTLSVLMGNAQSRAGMAVHGIVASLFEKQEPQSGASSIEAPDNLGKN